jgi:hypothetical protein
MAQQNKKGALKHIMINLGVMLVLVGATAVNGDNLMFTWV